jgi:hypothetical protein
MMNKADSKKVENSASDGESTYFATLKTFNHCFLTRVRKYFAIHHRKVNNNAFIQKSCQVGALTSANQVKWPR